MHLEMAVEGHSKFMDPASNVSSNPFHKPRPIESESAEKLEAQKADYEARIADMSKVYQANLENTIKDYEAKLSEKEKLQEIEIERVRDFIGHDVVDIKKKSETKLNHLAENYEAKIAHLESESQSKLENTIKHYETKLYDQRKSELTLKGIQTDYKTNIAEMEEYNAKLCHSISEHKTRESDMKKQYETKLNDEKKHCDWLLKEIKGEKNYEIQIDTIKKEHALESEAAQEDYEADLDRLNQSSAILQRAFADQSLELAALKETKTKEADFLSKSAQPDAEAKDAGLLADKKPDTNDKKPEIDALKGTIDALKDTVSIQMVAAEDLRETVKDLRERNAKLEAELQKK
ncbi:uncharacterized protein J4E78_010118 [Alternaria triticimaculans]|uniref:uncharacterized protein n=1 Tax=Alternaria triticimaculans TaxID=297637 RepID=UPI0020C42D91|nr:uncharacterized protein J4E78_010118 [Alternaria triticimaculans]KAI4642645.1 hypothetical protein J4E78_010118 [Alternaria triticimaculans]